MRASLSLILLFGCGRCEAPSEGPLEAAGTVEICLSSDVDQPDAPPDCASHLRNWHFSGVVVEDFASDEGPFTIGHCGRGSRTVKLLDGEGATWWFGVTALDAEGLDITPATPLVPGAAVSGELSVGWGGVPEQSAGYLEGPEGLALAGDTLAWWSSLEDPPLEINALEADAGPHTVDDCRVQPRVLEFVGDDTARLETGESGAVTLDGAAISLRVLAAWEGIPGRDSGACGDWIDRRAWVGGR